MKINFTHHVHVDAGVHRDVPRLRAVGGDGVVEQLTDPRPVADDHSIELPFVAQDVGEQMPVRVRRDARYLIERRHQRRGIRANCGVKRRQVDVAQRPLRHLGDVVIASTLGGPVRREMLHRRGNGVARAEPAPLKSAYARGGEGGAEVRIFAGPFDDASPPRIAGDVDHWREGPVYAHRGGFCRRYPCRALSSLRIPARRLGERHGEDRAHAVNDVEPKNQRDVKARLLDRDALQGLGRIRADDVQEGADRAVTELIHARGTLTATGPCRVPGAGDLIELAELFDERHPREDGIDKSRLGGPVR